MSKAGELARFASEANGIAQSVVANNSVVTGITVSGNISSEIISANSASINSLSTVLNFTASNSTFTPIVVPPGTTPSAPANGAIWTTANGLFVQVSGNTVALGAPAGDTIYRWSQFAKR